MASLLFEQNGTEFRSRVIRTYVDVAQNVMNAQHTSCRKLMNTMCRIQLIVIYIDRNC